MGFSGLWKDALRVILGVAARCKWAVLPRNSGVFGLGEGAARRFSARRTWAGIRGEKIFKKRGEKPKNWGGRAPEGGAGALYIERAGRFLDLEARPLAALLEVCFALIPQLQALA